MVALVDRISSFALCQLASVFQMLIRTSVSVWLFYWCFLVLKPQLMEHLLLFSVLIKQVVLHEYVFIESCLIHILVFCDSRRLLLLKKQSYSHLVCPTVWPEAWVLPPVALSMLFMFFRNHALKSVLILRVSENVQIENVQNQPMQDVTSSSQVSLGVEVWCWRNVRHGMDFVLLTTQDDSLSCQEVRNLPKALGQLLFSPFPWSMEESRKSVAMEVYVNRMVSKCVLDSGVEGHQTFSFRAILF